MSRWLQQQVQPSYPDVVILEVLEASFGYYPVDTATCMSWMQTNGLTHPVLRDKGGTDSIQVKLALQVKDVMVLDRQLKIVLRVRVTDTFAQNQVLNALSQLQ